MKEFINSFGKTNFIIILSIVAVIIIALIVTVIIEKLQNKKKNIDNDSMFEEIDELEKTMNLEKVVPITKEEEVISTPEYEEEIVYEEELTEEEAKKQLEEVTKKLVEDELTDLEGPTFFEKEQEENSIISYDELIKASQNIDEVNDMLLADEGSEPITIEELYKRHNEEENKNFDNPEFEYEEKKYNEYENKFKNSEVISPVFGIYENKSKLKEEKIEKKEEKKEDSDYLERTIDLEDLEQEIRKTEEFLKELKSLKNKLD